ncbi:MAG: cytochrome c biogenesis protein ResB [Bdellovibrionaceae bacterium]|nr:cytochrome c biogenesis protein ResB [Pseudobdellovibrionaceae bacterium]
MYKKVLKFLASIKLAVIVIIGIATLTAIGTFVESKYDAATAKKLVYDSIYMNIVMGVFAVNLIAVMVDRWPWKLRHISFIFAHVGILCIMAGQLITNQFGIDGSMRVGIGDENRFVSLPKTDITVYSSYDGTNYSKIFENEVDFFRSPPTPEKPFSVYKDQIGIKFTNYYPYAVASRETIASDNQKLGSGIRFQISNGQANFIEWLVQRNPTHVVSIDLGPLRVHFGTIPLAGMGVNEIYMKVEGNKIRYALFSKDQIDPKNEGTIEEGQAVPTGWMGLELRILRFLPKAEEKWKVEPRPVPTPLTTEAVEVEFQGKTKHWMLINDTVKFFADDAVFFVSYGNRRFDIGFPIYLNQFHMEKYQGTARAMSYRSVVSIKDLGEREISMNEPLKHNGLTIYQASFQDGPMGQPVASIFSINKDPGRWLKYLGSLIMTLGIIFLFYFKRLGTGVPANTPAKES